MLGPCRAVAAVWAASVCPLLAVDVVKVSVDVGGKTVPVTWHPGLDDVDILAQKVFNKDVSGFAKAWNEPVDMLIESLKLKRGWMVNGSHLNASALPIKRAQRTEEVHDKDESVLAVHMGHDSSIAVSRRGRVQCILELERLFQKRYMRPPVDDQAMFQSMWVRAFKTVQTHCACEDGWQPTHFTDVVMITPPPHETAKELLYQIIDKMFSIHQFRYVDHHHAHALSAFHSSPFRSALIFSYDAAGNDGMFNVYLGSFEKVRRIAQLDYTLGTAYDVLACLLPEVTGHPLDFFFDCETLGTDDLLMPKQPFYEADQSSMRWAGKLMGYAATGRPREDLRHLVRFSYEASNAFRGLRLKRYPRQLVQLACASEENQRDLAATIQSEFEEFLLSKVVAMVEHVGPQQLEGIVLTGGCALNVLANQRIFDTFAQSSSVYDPQKKRPTLQIYVSPAPNDSGLTLGALYAVSPPAVRQPLQYLGFELWDAEQLPRYARLRGARRLSALGGVEFLADLLAGGEVWQRERNSTVARPIIAVVRGRQEFGPRALGHRSLLAVPDADMHDRMNRLKVRQWYRPVAPMIAEEALHQVFGRVVLSPFMSMAPAVLPEVQRRFPSLVHLDGTARHQSVSHDNEPWVHALLLAVGKRTGLAALINTSFNTRGKPIVNTAVESLRMLDQLPDLDYVLIEDWLFKKGRRSLTKVS